MSDPREVDQLVLELREWESTLRDIEALPETNRSPRKVLWVPLAALGVSIVLWALIPILL